MPEDDIPPAYRVIQFNVTFLSENVGKMIVNTNQWTFVMNAHGLEPGTLYYFYCLGKYPWLARGTANENGDLLLKGSLDREKVNVMAPNEATMPKFALADHPLEGFNIGAELTAYYWFTPVSLSVHGELYDPWHDQPIPNQTIEVLRYSIIKGHYVHWKYATTDADGRFSVSGAAVMRRAPNVWTMPDPEFDACYPYCCIFAENGEHYNCVARLAVLDF